MRYYEVHIPGTKEPAITTNIRRLRNLPEGTRIHAVVTESDGSLADTWEIPVENGRAKTVRKGNRNSKSAHGKY